MNRRDFMKLSSAASAGLILGVHLPSVAGAKATTHELGAFVHVGTDDIVTIWVSRCDMGQDLRTSLPMIVAEELDADWSKVKIRQADLSPRYGDMGVGGSSSVRMMWTPLRQAGATARAMLVAAAAAKLGVDAKELAVSNGVISHPSGKKVTFGEVAEAAANVKIEGEVALKKPADFKIVGKATKRRDTPEIATGKAVYGMDVRVPGMLYAVVLRSPVFGGKVASFDATNTKAIAGVKNVVRVEALGADLPWNGVAVVATSTWAALKGRDALEVKWDEGPHARETTEALRASMADLLDKGTSVVDRGDLSAAMASAARKIEAVYELPFLAHAAMEPMNATAHVTLEGAEIWAPTQDPESHAAAAAKWLGIETAQVKMHVTLLGGGFGRRLNPDFVLEAVQIAKAVGAPVHVQWTREDDLRHGYYRPASHHKISAGLDGGGNLVAWDHRVSAPAIDVYHDPKVQRPGRSETRGLEDLPYAVPNYALRFAVANSGVPRGWWRGVSHSINGFVINSFLDELAHAAGKDPIELRLALLPKGFVEKAEGERGRWPYKSDRLRGVIELAREKSGWGKPLPAGRAMGFAAHYSYLSYTAEVAEVSVDEKGVPKVHRIVCAVDCGTVVNPDGVRAQMEGGIVYGLTAALGQRITIEGGRVQQSNFHDYPLLSIGEMPVVEVHIVPSAEPPTGTGEPGLPPAAPAVTNAMFKLTGKRVRTLPIA